MGIFRKFWKRDRGASSRAIATGDVVREPAATPQQVSFMALAEASATGQKPLSPWKLPEPPPFIGSSSAAMALDRAGGPGIADIYNWAVGGAFSEGLGFLGYQYLAELSQRPEYRRVSEIWAAEATRKWIKLNGNQERIDAIEKQLKKFNIRDHFRRLAELDGFFGRAQLFVDLGRDIGDPELQKPLVAKAKVKPGSIRNFKVIEPFWSYPGSYQSANPLAPDFYVPRQWFVMAGEVHSSRLLTIVGREMPDMLKPAYSFGGLALSQMIKPYVDNWLRTRQSVSDLIHSFSTPVLETDMATVLMGGTAQGLITRLQLMNQTRDNRGVFAINKDSEAFHIEATPLSGLEKLQAQAQEQIASVSGIPLVVLLGVTPSGLNASADGEIQTFYATIKAYQERVFRRPLERIIELVQRDLDGTVDDRITFEFIDLWETPEAEKAAVRKSDADMDVAYVGAGIVSNEEVRRRIVQDEDSPYYGAELDDDAPEMPGMGEELDEDGNPIPDGPDDDGGPGDDDGGGKSGQAQDAAEWSESKHPRSKDGKFGSGSGSAAFHAGPAKLDGGVRPSESGVYGPGVYVTKSREDADEWLFRAGPDAKVHEFTVKGDFASDDDFSDAITEATEKGFRRSEKMKEAQRILAERGFIGIEDGPVAVVFSPSSLRAGQAQDAAGDWEEGKHPRRKDGKFGSGGSGASKPAAKGEKDDKPAPAPAPAAKPPHPKVAAILGEQGVAKLREMIADPKSKAGDILAALKPLDDAQREMTPTLPHDVEPDEAFWKSRTYKTADGKNMTAGQARSYLEGVAASYAEADGGVGVKREKKARFLLGPPAAGKSTGAEQIARTEGYAIVDGDDAKKVIPEFDDGVGASAVHEESGKLSERVLLDMLDKGDNVILPLVGGSPGSIKRRIELLKAKGYDVTVDLVDVSEDNAARRMAGRALRTGRHISSGYFASIGDNPRKTYEALKADYPDAGFGVIDGNGGPKEERYKEAINHPTAKAGHKLFG